MSRRREPAGLVGGLHAMISRWRKAAAFDRTAGEKQVSPELAAEALAWGEARMECASEAEKLVTGLEGSLTAEWSEKDQDFTFTNPNGGWLCAFMQGGMDVVVRPFEERDKNPFGGRYTALMPGFRAQLLSRGYDPDTFTISVKKKEQST